MKTKKCRDCKKRKVISEFHKHAVNKDGLRNECKKCRIKKDLIYRNINKSKINKRVREYYKKFPCKKTFVGIKSRCTNKKTEAYKNYGGRGIECRITEEELKDLWFRDKAYLMEKPSIDRIDNEGHYEYRNCQYIERYENSVKDKRKSIIQYDLEGNFIKKWESIALASKHYKTSTTHICNVLKGRAKTALGFIWKYT